MKYKELQKMHASLSYKTLCSEYYDLDKPSASQDALAYYLYHAQQARGPILEPMCGTGNFLIPIAKAGCNITGFDNSPQMLDICRFKLQKRNIHCQTFESNFNKFTPIDSYDLIFIPNGSFCLLTQEQDVNRALSSMHKWLASDGKFILEIETLHAKGTSPGIWKGNWVKKSDGSLIVLNHTGQFDESTSIETVLCRYEHWDGNKITQTEVEEFSLKLYSAEKIEGILKQHGFEIIKRLQPYSDREVQNNATAILYECIKKR